MTIPFIGLFKRLLRNAPTDAPTAIRAVAVEKPAAERLSKTVLPNTTRTLSQPDPFSVASGAAKLRGRDGSSAVAFGPEAGPERAISLQVADVLDRMPPGYLKTEGVDTKRLISLKALEFEKGMATGEPAVCVGSIYEQVPEIFLRNVSPDDSTQVVLPYDKVLEQISSFQVRSDQTAEQAVPQVETPILQVTLEDTKKFGTEMTPLRTSALPPVKVEFASAKSLSNAEPEPVARGKTSRPTVPTGRRTSASGPVEPPPSDTTARPARIPFHLPPNGTGASASERVPASSGPPVPNSEAVAGPARIPFKMSPPCADLRPKFTLVPGVDPEEVKEQATKAAEAKTDDRKVALGLQSLMQNLPAFQLGGNASDVPADVRVELPYSVIEPQLVTGRVAIDPKTFHAAIPEQFRHLFVVDPTETPVLLPLQEVLKNLPETALQMRADQHKEEAVNYFQTPFSMQAEQDAQRFQGSATAAKPTDSEPQGEEKPVEPAAAANVSVEDQGAAEKTVAASGSAEMPATDLANAADQPAAEPEPVKEATEDKNQAKDIVARVSALPGVAGCSVTFADGLSLAGNISGELAAEGLCAMAPSLLQRLERHMPETNLGQLSAMTIYCTKSAMTFWMQGSVCLAVVHVAEKLETETQQKLAEMVKELSQIYTQPDTAHVDH